MSAVAKVREEPLENLVAAPPQVAIFVPDEAPASWFYGWLMLPLTTLLMVATSPGQTFGVAYFNTRFLEEFSLSKTGLSLVYLAATLAASLLIPFVGAGIDRCGLRRSALWALAAMSAACVFASQISGITTMLLAFLAPARSRCWPTTRSPPGSTRGWDKPAASPRSPWPASGR
jgi:MFS family permease